MRRPRRLLSCLHLPPTALIPVFVLLTLASPLSTALAVDATGQAQPNELSGGQPDAQPTVRYDRDVRPILADLCFACHGTDENAREADLRLDQSESAVALSAIVPGDAKASEMISRIQSKDPDQIMPPPHSKKTVSDKQIQTLVRWINQGAKYEQHWSLVAPQVEPPAHTANPDWRKNKIDDYVTAKLDEVGLKPAAEADPHQLFRRLHLDITGLPPTPVDRLEFVNDYQQRGEVAYDEWIDRLMDKPSWGEHRGRYWLDAARYADTHGMHFDNYREMWPYRDWVIKAFNQNQPFDQFVIEQIAGDLLDHPSESQLIATGFQRCNMTTNEGGTIDEENLALYAADRVQTFGWVFLGLTTNCAQCHDHKFDPITMTDYYSLAAFFRNTTQGPKDGNSADGRGPVLVVPSESDRPRWDAIPAEIAAANQAAEQLKDSLKPKIDDWADSLTPNLIDELAPSADLVAHLPLNEGQGNDLRVYGELNATLHVEKGVSWQHKEGRDAAPVLERESPIDIGPIGRITATDAFSFSAFVNVPAEGGGSLIAKMDLGPQFRGWDLFRQGNALAVHLVDSWPDNAFKVGTRGDVLRPGKWQHVAVTYDGSSRAEGIKIFIGGKEQSTVPQQNTFKAGGSFLTDVPLRFGARHNDPAMAGLAISDFRFYRRSLSTAEIESLVSGDSIKRFIANAKPDKEWNDKQRETIQNYYLSVVDQEYPKIAERIDSLSREKSAIEARSPVTHIQEERKDSSAMAYMLIRGQYDQKGDQVSAATPLALHPMKDDQPKNRLGLARWLVDPANPLTARVTVNRFWQQVFGRGLVPTTEDFGVTGTLPANPQLLDFLAVDFQQNGWDVKRFFKQIFLSAAYRQAAVTTPEKLLHDRDNALLSRGPRFRMDAEMVRDSALASSGLLSDKMYGPGVRPYQPIDIWNIVGLPESNTRDYRQDHDDGLYRRTLYSFWKRMAPPPNMEALNAPSRETCVVRRERTNTPLQALVTLNDPQFVEAARHLAESVLSETRNNDRETLQQIAQRVLCRDISDRENEVLLESLGEFTGYYESHPDDAAKLIAVGESKPVDSIPATMLAAWTLVCNQVMNLDEVVCK
ncbi:MAG: DUF1553 domain-containing protein [Planctomycetales bacterium]|nr:DUF1553 domain-containing protein [Planctomycetales bacterium]